MINKATLIGRLGKDAEIKQTQNSQLCTFSVATSESYKDDKGEWKEITEWHNVVAWGKLAELCGKLIQGQLVYIEGKLKTDTYDKDGQKHYSTKVVANTVRRLEFKQTNNEPKKAGIIAWDGSGHTSHDNLPF